MDRALWLLLWLRFVGWVRRLRHNVRTLKGMMLALLGSLVFAPWLLSILKNSGPADVDHLAEVRLFGPLMLLGYCVLAVVFSTAERAITFSPPEINFLFSGPFTRRQLLAYKILAGFASAVLASLLLALVLRSHALSPVAAFLGLLLAVEFLQFFNMVVALLGSLVGQQAYSRRRLILFSFLGFLLLLAFFRVGWDVFRLKPWQFLDLVEQTPAWRVVLAPFRCFVETFTAERVWPDLVQWMALGLLVDALAVSVIFAVDAQYLETSAAASERIYAQLQKLRSGGMTALTMPGTGTIRWSLPALPWWGGAGPIAWRQLTAIPRSRGPLLMLLIFSVMVISLLSAQLHAHEPDEHQPLLVVAVVLGMILLLTPMVPYDFRGDIDRIDVLKSLPIPPAALAAGQLAAPVALVATLQWLLMGIVFLLTRKEGGVYVAAAAYALPINFMLFGIENTLFLWFPTRLAPATPGDFQNLGRHVLLFFAKVVTAGTSLALSALVGLGTYLLIASETLALVTAWLALACCAGALLPLLAHAFSQFDASRDTPP